MRINLVHGEYGRKRMNSIEQMAIAAHALWHRFDFKDYDNLIDSSFLVLKRHADWECSDEALVQFADLFYAALAHEDLEGEPLRSVCNVLNDIQELGSILN